MISAQISAATPSVHSLGGSVSFVHRRVYLVYPDIDVWAVSLGSLGTIFWGGDASIDSRQTHKCGKFGVPR